ncbi:MFS transporter [Acidiphilium iwatense]|uniref:MFS transporter n=1 Tax=Acidiphilium iwatense TaxID=768198 RepID=A0ABS9DYR6_9PROT|nr:MFS transporter [Acidiphilium iwatense]MCF3947829.1 MFS transporter [Acidiphilium iwatense]
MAINFADKAVIGLSAVQIMGELHLKPAEFGLLGSSFFLLFSVSSLAIGFLANRIKSYYIIAGLALVWSAAQLPIAFFASFQILLLSRIALGAGEGPAFPMALHAAYKWFQNDNRNIPTAVVQQGVNVGLMLAGPILTFFIVRYGWHSAFLFLGVLGMAWTIAWMLLGGEGAVNDTTVLKSSYDRSHVALRVLLFDKTSLSLVLIYFIEYSAIALYFTWLPSYLHLGLKFSEVQTGWLFAIISGSWIPMNLILADVSRRLKAAGYSSRVARGIVCSATPAIGGIVFMMLSLPLSSVSKVFCLAIGGVLTQTIFMFGPLILGEICPETQRGGIFGILSSIGTLGGIIAPFVMGHIIQSAIGTSASGYQNGYLLLGALLVAIGVFGLLFVNPEKSLARFSHLSKEYPESAGLKSLSEVGRG